MLRELREVKHVIRSNKDELENALTVIAGKQIVIVGENFPEDLE
jgi:hypothetical protein